MTSTEKFLETLGWMNFDNITVDNIKNGFSPITEFCKFYLFHVLIRSKLHQYNHFIKWKSPEILN